MSDTTYGETERRSYIRKWILDLLDSLEHHGKTTFDWIVLQALKKSSYFLCFILLTVLSSFKETY